MADAAQRKTNWTKQNGDFKIKRNHVLRSDQDEYEIRRKLGRGTFGQVVKCLKKSSNQFVAIKILKNCSYYVDDVENEKRMLGLIMKDTPEKFNFVRAFDIFVHKNHTCIEFELLEKNLQDFLTEQSIPTKAVGYILHQLLTALVRLKQLEIVHADIKSLNIMFVDSVRFPYRVKLIDFGSALKINDIAQGDYITTRYYRSPEVILGSPYTEKTDLWSLGCIAAELLTRDILYPGLCEHDQIRLICEMQGLPPDSMLEVALKTALFFNRTAEGFQLKPSEEEKEETEKDEGATENRRYCSKIKQLQDIASFNVPSDLNGKEWLEEIFARTTICTLITEMLQIDPEVRITAEEALNHEAVCDDYGLDGSSEKR